MVEMIKARKAELQKEGKKGFTLMEMLIVVAIIAVLVAIAIPVFSTQLNNAKIQADAANIRSGYAAVSAEVLTATTAPADDTVYNLNSDGSVTAGATTGSFTTQGSTGTDTQSIAGQSISWAAGAHVTYTWDGSKVVINNPA